ncbi:Radical SAM domain protein [Syntrophobotulus glycolicus DSM 8271]|uniref:Radical SAM domain protein n=1 Tax=Syntrophobotulus glycolicus (strain DSM 8271 / FlGlyR) TaxID=645991 RepID=F0SWD5_SYNGF|nr:radical SAM protein [Syntrophobotulus glycolicus]ADY55701.1 Radical SAM domain protein [Syntrophobotulus glycolicus DSM 8271]
MHDKEVKGILSAKNGMNLYRGCTHGCIYCDSRSRCYQMDHDFEDVEIKRNAPELLEAALRRKRRRCMITTGSMCDPYLPLEKKEKLTRCCLELIDSYGFGFSVITKSHLVLRDLDLLKRINRKTKCVVQMTLTTVDEDLCRVLEPKVCTTAKRAEVLNILRDEGIPTVVWLSPILPFINDTEANLRGILNRCFEAKVKGVICFGMGVTLREGDREYFYKKLDEHFPGMKQRYIETFGNRYSCDSPNQTNLMKIFREQCQRQGVLHSPDAVFTYLNEFEDKQSGEQMTLF